MNTDIIPPVDPWSLFTDWFALATQQEASYPDAMMLATVGASGMPSVRTVLMKGFDSRGVVFYTNRESRKGHDLADNARAGICFYWKSLQRQVRMEGHVVWVSEAESDAYFVTRPRGSQIGAWASRQSQLLDSRAFLEQRVAELDKQHEGRDIPRPPHWGGYRLVPTLLEFWQERSYRLHDRIVYNRQPGDDAWTIERLFP